MLRGLVETTAGWVFAIGHRGQRRVSMLINFDAKNNPDSFTSSAGSRTIHMTQREALELSEALRNAATLDVLVHAKESTDG